jgi:toxin-antitoxin system PIN domain toxin
MKRTALLDVNVLVALHWPAHEFHQAANEWLDRRGTAKWSTCPVTQLAFVRLLCSPAYTPDCLSPKHAADLLVQVVSHRHHEFWPDSLMVSRALEPRLPQLQGHRQITDCYLLALAAHRRGILATFDRGMRSLAAGTESYLEVIGG